MSESSSTGPTEAPPDVTDTVTAPPSEAESVEDWYARVEAAFGPDGRLPVAVEEMPGWDIFPFEVDSLRVKPLAGPAVDEPARRGESAADCWCTTRPDGDDGTRVWSNARWVLDLAPRSGLPLMLSLLPREHHDLPTLPGDLAAEMGQLMTAVCEALEHVPSIGRGQLAKYGDGGAHLHVLFLGRPARMLQLRGSPLLDWEENLPRLPLEVMQANARVVAERLVVHVGGRAGTLGR
jgi:hypothetical protein